VKAPGNEPGSVLGFGQRRAPETHAGQSQFTNACPPAHSMALDGDSVEATNQAKQPGQRGSGSNSTPDGNSGRSEGKVRATLALC
jgi:hypothetical protein